MSFDINSQIQSSRKARAILIALLLFGIFYLIYTFSSMAIAFNNISRLKTYKVQVLKSEDNEADYKLVKYNPNWIPLSSISYYLKWSVIVSEDWAFYSHNGIDIYEIKEAITKSITEIKPLRGASTITQQVVKNLFLTNERSIIRKIKEVILAFKLEKKLKKRQILEIYFNIIEWGDNVYGIKEAAKYYFKKDPSALNIKESAFLAYLIPSPIKYSKNTFAKKRLTRAAAKRLKLTYLKLHKAGVINEETLLDLITDPSPF